MKQRETKFKTPKKEEENSLIEEKNQNKEINKTSASTDKKETISFICKKENDKRENFGEIITNLTIKSYCRFNPTKEIDKFFTIIKDEDSISIKSIFFKSKYVKSKIKFSNFDKIYKFYKIFDRDSTNKEVYKSLCKPLIYDLIFNKKSGLIFAYGNSKGGKTFTIFGTPENPGILPQSLYDIFNHVNKKDNKSLQIYCNFIEINNEEIYDLLCNEMEEEDNCYKKKINLIENSNKFFFENVNYIKLDDFSKVKNIIQRVFKIKNKERNLSSNLLFKIIILNDRKFSKIDLLSNEYISLTFVDLGTKEKIKGNYLRKENQSIHNLEKCLQILKFNKLAKEKKVVPFKDSVLTKIISEYFLSKNNIKLICNINPRKDDIKAAITSIKISSLHKDSILNKSKSSINSKNSKILDNKEKSKIKGEKANNQETNEENKNMINILENVKKEREKNKNNTIIDEIEEFISNNSNKCNNFNFRNISQNIRHQTLKNDIIEEKTKNKKKTQSQIMNSSEIDKLMKEKIDILISEIQKLRAEVDLLKSENKDKGFYYSRDYLGNIPPIIPKNKNKCYSDNFQNPFNPINIRENNNNKEEKIDFANKENENFESNDNFIIPRKDTKSPFSLNPFGILYYDPFRNIFNPFCPFPYKPFFQKNSYWPSGKEELFEQNNIKAQSTNKEYNNSNIQYINNIAKNKNLELYKSEYSKKENYYDFYENKFDYYDNEDFDELKKEKVKKTPKKKNNKKRKKKKYIEKKYKSTKKD